MSFSNAETLAIVIVGATILFGIAAMVIGARSVTWDIRRLDRRAARLPAVATALGADYLLSDPSVLAPFDGVTPFMRDGFSATVTHVIRINRHDAHATFFDLHIAAADVPTDEDMVATVAMFDFGSGGLPAFRLRRVRRLETPMDAPRVALPEDPAFAKRFLIISHDDLETRRLLTPTLRKFIDDHAEWTIESTGAWLAMCRNDRSRPSAETYPAFVREALEFYRAFRARG
jgi:hypothetical protein